MRRSEKPGLAVEMHTLCLVEATRYQPRALSSKKYAGVSDQPGSAMPSSQTYSCSLPPNPPGPMELDHE